MFYKILSYIKNFNQNLERLKFLIEDKKMYEYKKTLEIVEKRHNEIKHLIKLYIDNIDNITIKEIKNLIPFPVIGIILYMVSLNLYDMYNIESKIFGDDNNINFGISFGIGTGIATLFYIVKNNKFLKEKFNDFRKIQ